MRETLEFSCRAQFRQWLEENCLTSGGIWLLFGKAGGPKTIAADEALEEALCFGWIDGQMQSLGESAYRKYFSRRTASSKWSERNKLLTERLERQGIMTDYGRSKIAEAKENGQWFAQKPQPETEEQIAFLLSLLEGLEPARTNFLAMPASVQRTYTRAYLDAKTDAGRERRLAWMVDRLNRNLKPM